MRGMYEIQTLSSVSGVSIFGRILENFSVAISVIFLIVMAVCSVFLSEKISPGGLVQPLWFIFGGMAIFSVLSLLSLAWMTFLALRPLRRVIRWAKTANSFERQPVNLNDTSEVSEVSAVINELLSRLELSQQALIDAEKAKAVSQMSAQVAHDIRAPLLALEVVSADLPGASEETCFIFREAIERIQDISNNLLRAYCSGEQENQNRMIDPLPPHSCLIEGLIHPIVTEKKAQYRNRPEIQIHFKPRPDAQNLSVRLHPGEFKRVLSNLIDNAVEAIVETGWVSLETCPAGSNIEIVCRDSGRGIPPQILPLLGREGQTFGKLGGSGLGLFQAKTTIEGWGGSLTVESQTGQGTQVSILLPLDKTKKM